MFYQGSDAFVKRHFLNSLFFFFPDDRGARVLGKLGGLSRMLTILISGRLGP